MTHIFYFKGLFWAFNLPHLPLFSSFQRWEGVEDRLKRVFLAMFLMFHNLPQCSTLPVKVEDSGTLWKIAFFNLPLSATSGFFIKSGRLEDKKGGLVSNSNSSANGMSSQERNQVLQAYLESLDGLARNRVCLVAGMLQQGMEVRRKGFGEKSAVELTYALSRFVWEKSHHANGY